MTYSPTLSRCGCCGSRDFVETTRHLNTHDGKTLVFSHACSHCGLLVDSPGGSTREISEQISHAVAQSAFTHRITDGKENRWGMDIYTLRTAATRYLRRTTPADSAQRFLLKHPHAEFAAEAHLDDLLPTPPTKIEIAVLCRRGELDGCLEKSAAWRDAGLSILIVVDAGSTCPSGTTIPQHLNHGPLRILKRRLGGDFSAQRNFAQMNAGRPWMLQIDADESLDQRLLRSLDALAEMADRDDILSIGFPRRNFVDGTLSDVYPDIQYRLNRASVRFEGRVHERPALAGGWRQSFIALTGAINHHLSASHVAERSQRYETLSPGRGRLGETQSLMRPFRP